MAHPNQASSRLGRLRCGHCRTRTTLPARKQCDANFASDYLPMAPSMMADDPSPANDAIGQCWQANFEKRTSVDSLGLIGKVPCTPTRCGPADKRGQPGQVVDTSLKLRQQFAICASAEGLVGGQIDGVGDYADGRQFAGASDRQYWRQHNSFSGNGSKIHQRLATCAGAEGLVGGQVDGVGNKADGAIAEEKIAAAGMEAADRLYDCGSR